MEPEIIFIIVAFVVLVIVKGIYDERKERKRILDIARKSFGKKPQGDNMPERLRFISAYNDALPKRKEDIDEITWQDLDMERVFTEMNATNSAVGEEYLYSLLHRPETEEEPLLELEKRVQLFSENVELREQYQIALAKMGKLRSISLYDYIMRFSGVREESNWKHYLALACYLGGLGLLFAGFTLPGVWVFIIVGLYNLVTYFQRKGEIEPFLQVVAYLIRWLDNIKKLSKMPTQDSKELDADIATLRERQQAFGSFARGARLLTPSNPTGSMMDMLLDYFRMMFHMDLIKFNQMYRVFLDHQDDIHTLFTITGRIDSAICIASYRKYKQDWCIPKLSSDKDQSLEMIDLYHPLVQNAVKNSIHASRPVLLTGSNASGKSTFLKAVAINSILAQTIHTSLAREYQGRFYSILSSMALRDDLEAKESYFIVEIKSLKRILNKEQEETPVLCFVDEVLRGTNTAERIAASSQILLQMAKSGVLCFAATHDIELTTILEKEYDNYHFSEQVTENDVVFDYALREGKATSRNAIALLRVMEYPPEVVANANRAVEHFLETGEWRRVNEG